MDIAMNRRTFVGGAVAAGVAAATVKAAPLAQADENVVDADIAIVGGGMSGLVCALQAAQEGAHVVMLTVIPTSPHDAKSPKNRLQPRVVSPWSSLLETAARDAPPPRATRSNPR